MSSGIDAVNSGPIILRTYNDNSINKTIVLGNYDIPISSNYVLITSANGNIAPSDNIYVSSISSYSIYASSINVSSINGSEYPPVNPGPGTDNFWTLIGPTGLSQMNERAVCGTGAIYPVYKSGHNGDIGITNNLLLAGSTTYPDGSATVTCSPSLLYPSKGTNPLVFTQTSAPSSAWRGAAMSASGQYQASVFSAFDGIMYGYIYRSIDYGQNWSPCSLIIVGSWYAVAMSASGQYQTAVGSNIYRSIDYGVTWSPCSPIVSGNRYAIAMSSSGQYQTTVVNNGNIYRSVDYGVTWSPVADARSWNGIAMSASGQYQTAVVNVGNIYRSVDYGVTWSPCSPIVSGNWYAVAMSASGQYQTAVVNNGNIYRSINYGVTWITVAEARSWYAVAMSASGQYQTAVVYGRNMWYSVDYGVTWIMIKSDYKNWSGIAVSSSGEYQTVVVKDGNIYTCVIPYQTISANTITAKDVTVSDITYADRSATVTCSPSLLYPLNGTNPLVFTQISPLNCTGIAMSAYGQYQTAVNGNIYRSVDYGVTWITVTNSGNWKGVAMSASGQYQTAIDYSSINIISYSIDYGQNWNSYSVVFSVHWYGVAMSASGQYQTAVMIGGEIWYSVNYGLYWSPVADVRSWHGIAMSASGQYQTAVVNGGNIYRSVDYGVTWSPVADSQSWYAVGMSASGQYQTAGINDTFEGTIYAYIYRSIDYGVTWSILSNQDFYGNWQGIAISASGQYQTAVIVNGNDSRIYYSTNYGVLWVPCQSDSNIWSGIAMSSSGQYQTAVSNGGGIYTCIIPYQSVISKSFKIPGGTSAQYLRADGTTGAKSFIIDHPLNPNKYLVHACLEGPEAGVYYRGTSEIEEKEKIIELPDYVSFANEFTINLTPIYNGKPRILSCSKIINKKFTVYGEPGEFYWTVFGKRYDIDVEPYKDSVVVKGDGPYKYLKNLNSKNF